MSTANVLDTNRRRAQPQAAGAPHHEISPGWRGSTLWASLASSALLWAPFPPLDLWPLAWIAPLGWLWLIRKDRLEGRRPYLVLWLAGFVFWMAALNWLRLPHWATSFGWVALSIYLGLYLPAMVALSRVAVHRLRISIILAAPIVWTGLELLRGHLLGGFTMASLGHTQYHWLELIQIADLVGAYGVGFVVMFAAACLASALPLGGRKPRLWPLLPMAGIISAALIYGERRLDHPPGPQGPRVALIQGSIDTEMKHDPAMRERVFRQYFNLSLRAVDGKPDLIVWPETMYRDPLILGHPDTLIPAGAPWTIDDLNRSVRESRRRLGELAHLLGCDLLLGIDVQDYTSHGLDRYNSAVYVSRDGHLRGRYDKSHPVMFGEYIPLADVFPWLYKLTPLAGGIRAGSTNVAFDLANTRLAASICYETVLPQVILGQIRRLAAIGQEPDILVNLTNSGWYWGSSELEMHLVCDVFRAVECRKPLLVAANTGISAWIDGDGRIIAQGPKRANDVIMADVRLDPRISLYARFGDWFAGICLVGCLFFAAAGLASTMRGRRLARAETALSA